MRAELLRYGEWTRAGEYRYDHPFLLGSRRIGPDLNRVGGKYADGWHYEHMRDPRSMTAGSVMPKYAWLLDRRIDPSDVRSSLRALRAVGVPYTDADLDGVAASLATQGSTVVARLAESRIHADPDLEIIALIAYLQRLGQDGRRAIDAGLTARSGTP
jgi:cytochrome c oxidase cbb3-type subunit I/II